MSRNKLGPHFMPYEDRRSMPTSDEPGKVPWTITGREDHFLAALAHDPWFLALACACALRGGKLYIDDMVLVQMPKAVGLQISRDIAMQRYVVEITGPDSTGGDA